MINKEPRNVARKRRHKRVRRKIMGTAERPRLNVYRSLGHIYAQMVDDINSNTLVSASSLDKEIKEGLPTGGNREAAQKVGELLARRAMEKNIDKVIFDRGGYHYHGRVKALAEEVRQAGIEF